MKDLETLLKELNDKQKELKKKESEVKKLKVEIEKLSNEAAGFYQDDLSTNGVYEDDNVIVSVEEKASTKMNVIEILKKSYTDQDLRKALLEEIENGMPCSLSKKFQKNLMLLYPENYEPFLAFDISSQTVIKFKEKAV